MPLVDRLELSVPLIQAPMAGVSTPALAAAVCEAGALGSLGVGSTDADGARVMIADLQARTGRPFNVNVFVHTVPADDPEGEAAWLEALAPEFARFGARAPAALRTIYRSFAEDDDMLRALVELRPAVVSLHFGLPNAARVAALKDAGCLLLATATSLEEAVAARAAGADAVVAQGIEAGGHRGVFDPGAPDDGLGVLALTQLLVARAGLPVIAAGGLMNGRGVSAVLRLGAVAAQLGTAFIACPESAADDAYRAALFGPGALHTVMTDGVSGRPARCLANRFTAWAAQRGALRRAGYPRAYHAGKALNAAARAAGEGGYGAHWAGQGAPFARSLPAGELVRRLAEELAST